jgi:hypothetical protein
MQKIWLLFVLVTFSSLAQSQDSTEYTLNNIKRYATHIEESYSIISSNIEADKQQPVVQQAETIKVYIDSIEGEMEYLPDEYYYRLSSLVSSYHTDVEEFEKLLLNKDFQGKDKYLARAFTSLQQRQNEFRKALGSANETALPQQSVMENKPGNALSEHDTMQVIEQPEAASNTPVVNSSNNVLVEAVDPNEIKTANNALLLDTIHQAQQQIEQWMVSIHLAMKKSHFNKVGVFANSISNASLKISDLTLLLRTDQKQNLFILATGLKNLSETLHQLSLKGTPVHNEMQACIDKMKIKFSTLSTGIHLVQ